MTSGPVDFLLLQQNTRDGVIHKEIPLVTVLEAETSRPQGLCLVQAILLCHPMVEGWKDRTGTREREGSRT